MKTNKTRYYGVSFGNGNDGVSQLWPAFIKKTDDPWQLAEDSIVSEIRDDLREWARESVYVDGEAEHTVYAVLDEGPNGETEFDSAWLICEVFPLDADDVANARCPVYES